MNTHLLSLFILFILVQESMQAQKLVGNTYDARGIPIDIYFDPLAYESNVKLALTFEEGDYVAGYCYDINGQKLYGQFKLENGIMRFQKEEYGRVKKIKPNEFAAVVIGVDSFLRINNFILNDEIITEPEYVQFISEFNGVTFMKHYDISSRAEQKWDRKDKAIESYLAKTPGDSIWDNLNDKPDTINSVLTKYFNNVPMLSKRIQSVVNPGPNTIYDFIKTAEYWNKYVNNEPIYFDNNWVEIQKHNYNNFANIRVATDTLWTLDYFIDSTLTYTVNYKTIFPQVREGALIAYNTNGSVRKKTTYQNNKPYIVECFNTDGKLYNKYEFTMYTQTKVYVTNPPVTYSVVEGMRLDTLETPGQFTIDVFDNATLRNYTRSFKDFKLVESFYIKDNIKIYQQINHNYDVNISKLQEKLDYQLNKTDIEKYPRLTTKGVVLVSLLINQQGRAVDFRLFNSIETSHEDILERFFKDWICKDKGEKFVPYIFNKEKVYCEIIFPVLFSSIGFLKQEPVFYENYWYDQNNFWFFYQNQQMMNQQLMNQQQRMINQMNFNIPRF